MKPNIGKQKKTLLTLSGFLLFTTLLTGCASVQVGRDFDVQLFNSMAKNNVTTKKQVLEWIGNPASTGVSIDKAGDRSEEWMYFYGTGAMPKMENAKLKILQIRFDQNGKIISFNWSNSK